MRRQQWDKRPSRVPELEGIWQGFSFRCPHGFHLLRKDRERKTQTAVLFTDCALETKFEACLFPTGVAGHRRSSSTRQ
eukprot:6413140-Amphidinium_carterae.1